MVDGGRPPTQVSQESVCLANARIKHLVHQTPVLTSSSLDGLCPAGTQLFFKCEALQKTGSFKARGSSNAVANLAPGVKDVVTHSSGNHAQALAWAAKMKGIRAHIVMPETAPAVKRAAVESYGAHIYLCPPTLEARQAKSQEILAATGGHFVHPSDDPVVISGQGTVALEFLEQVPDLDALVVPVGGGGLIAGISTYAKSSNPSIIILGAEPQACDDAYRSKAQGKICGNVQPVKTLADGLMTMLGEHTFPAVMSFVDHIVTVSEADIARGVKLIYERLKIAIEPSAGVGVAVALNPEVHQRYLPPGKSHKLGVILCGGNMDLVRLGEILRLAQEGEGGP